jgi:hypothetical protein
MEKQTEVADKIAKYLTENFCGHKKPNELFVDSKDSSEIICINKYVQRLIKFSNRWAEESDGPDSLGVRCAVLAVQYLERADLEISKKSFYRSFMAAFLIGFKLLFDSYMSNQYWADVTGYKIDEVNSIESEFCRELCWDIQVNPEFHEMRFKELLT